MTPRTHAGEEPAASVFMVEDECNRFSKTWVPVCQSTWCKPRNPQCKWSKGFSRCCSLSVVDSIKLFLTLLQSSIYVVH